LKELWSLLHFLLPNIFTDWEAFESWFDFSDLEDEQGTEEFIADQKKQELVKKIHLILQPMLLRRVKSDVASYLPKKREYVLFAPMTKEQTDLYNVLTNKKVDTRQYLENKVLERLNASASATPSAKSSRSSSRAPPKTMSLPVRESPRKKEVVPEEPAPNAFSVMMNSKRGRGRPRKNAKPDTSIETPGKPGTKRKNHPVSLEPEPKSTKSSRQSTPIGLRGRPRKTRTYKDAGSDEEKMSDDEFEAKLAKEIESDDEDHDDKASMTPEERERAEAFELASKFTLY
jgi:ATP-dependent DNA helicase